MIVFDFDIFFFVLIVLGSKTLEAYTKENTVAVLANQCNTCFMQFSEDCTPNRLQPWMYTSISLYIKRMDTALEVGTCSFL